MTCKEVRDLSATNMTEGHKGLKAHRVIGVMSGKGGVGKSLATSMLAVAMRKAGKKVGILDADLTGPSIPAMFGIKDKVKYQQTGSAGLLIVPVKSESGIEIVSVNCMLDDPTDPVVWNGHELVATLKRFWWGVGWQGLDVLLIDTPPGTGDIAMTVFDSLPVDGIVVVGTPQKLVGMMVMKCMKAAARYGVDVIGVVQNMSYYECRKCGCREHLFGSHAEAVELESEGITVASLPIDPVFSVFSDSGRIEDMDVACMKELAARLSRPWETAA